jgi:hypothetical protein
LIHGRALAHSTFSVWHLQRCDFWLPKIRDAWQRNRENQERAWLLAGILKQFSWNNEMRDRKRLPRAENSVKQTWNLFLNTSLKDLMFLATTLCEHLIAPLSLPAHSKSWSLGSVNKSRTRRNRCPSTTQYSRYCGRCPRGPTCGATATMIKQDL